MKLRAAGPDDFDHLLAVSNDAAMHRRQPAENHR